MWLKRYGFSKKQDKDIVMDDLTVDRDNNVAFISKEKFYYYRNAKFVKSSKKSCYSGVAAGPETEEIYLIQCKTNRVILHEYKETDDGKKKHAHKSLKKFEVSHISSQGNGDLVAVGKNDKQVHRYSAESGEWTTVGDLTNALKVTGGPDDSVFAIIEGDTVVKYNKRKETWEPFSDKENIHEVAANGAGGVYFQTKDLELFATSDEPLLEEQIIDCR